MKQCELNCAVISADLSGIEIERKRGYRFNIEGLTFFVRYAYPIWIVIDAYTGFSFCRERKRADVIEKAKIVFRKRGANYIEAVNEAAMLLKKAGIKVPVNEVRYD